LDESDLQATVAGRILLLHLLEQLISSGPRHVSLELPTRQAVLRELAFGFGFRGVSGQPHLAKIVAGRVLTMATWTSIRNDLAAKGGPKLPTAIPTFHSIDQQISVLTPSGNQAHIPLEALETLLSPALLCLPGRSAVITPIQRRFSEALLGHPKQDGLLPQSSASSYQNRHYLASPRSLNYFKRGSLMFFYESTKHAGRAELVAVARVRQAYVKAIASIGPDLAQSVLTESSLSEIGSSDEKTVVSFDNLFHLPNGVPLSSLKRMGFGRPNDLITTRSINDTQTQEILKEAFGNG
jgi:hypothetical protein